MELVNKYFINIIKNKYAQFAGRASRSEFWYFALFYFILSFILGAIDTFVINPMLGGTTLESAQGGILLLLVALGLLIPIISLSIRRLHDIGKSGWWLLISLIPIIGALVLLYFYVCDSQAGSNMYGENPKGL